MTYYQTLDDAPWPLKLDKPKKRQKFLKNLDKICKFCQGVHRGADGVTTFGWALNARGALAVYPVFEDEKSKASDKKLVKQKIA